MQTQSKPKIGNGATPLFMALHTGRTDVLTVLPQNNANITKKRK